MSEPKFKIGDYVKQNPVGIVKKIIAIELPDKDNKFDKSFWYKLEDSFGWQPEYKLTLDKKENLSLSYDRAQELKIKHLQAEVDRLKKENELLGISKNAWDKSVKKHLPAIQTLTSQLEKAEKKNAILMEALEPFRDKKSFPRITEALEKIKLLEAGE